MSATAPVTAWASCREDTGCRRGGGQERSPMTDREGGVILPPQHLLRDALLWAVCLFPLLLRTPSPGSLLITTLLESLPTSRCHLQGDPIGGDPVGLLLTGPQCDAPSQTSPSLPSPACSTSFPPFDDADMCHPSPVPVFPKVWGHVAISPCPLSKSLLPFPACPGHT